MEKSEELSFTEFSHNINTLISKLVAEIDKYKIINKCETPTELRNAILRIGKEDPSILSRNDLEYTANIASGIARGLYVSNLITKKYGIRQQAIYIYRKQDEVSSFDPR